MDDPAVWWVTSAWHDAMPERETPERPAHRRGWWLGLQVEEFSAGYFRVVLDDALTWEERSQAVGRATWPLLRVPCGVALIGEGAVGRSILREPPGQAPHLEIAWHDRMAVVLVEPGNYQVDLLQYLNGGRPRISGPHVGPQFLFHFQRLSDDQAQQRTCPDTRAFDIDPHVPAELRPSLSRDTRQQPGWLMPLLIADRNFPRPRFGVIRPLRGESCDARVERPAWVQELPGR